MFYHTPFSLISNQNNRTRHFCLQRSLRLRYESSGRRCSGAECKARNFSAFSFLGDCAVSLRGEEVRACFFSQSLFLRKSDAILHNLVPNSAHGMNIFFRIFSDYDFFHDFSLIFPNAKNYSERGTRGQGEKFLEFF